MHHNCTSALLGPHAYHPRPWKKGPAATFWSCAWTALLSPPLPGCGSYEDETSLHTPSQRILRAPASETVTFWGLRFMQKELGRVKVGLGSCRTRTRSPAQRKAPTSHRRGWWRVRSTTGRQHGKPNELWSKLLMQPSSPLITLYNPFIRSFDPGSNNQVVLYLRIKYYHLLTCESMYLAIYQSIYGIYIYTRMISAPRRPTSMHLVHRYQRFPHFPESPCRGMEVGLEGVPRNPTPAFFGFQFSLSQALTWQYATEIREMKLPRYCWSKAFVLQYTTAVRKQKPPIQTTQ